MAHFLVTKSVDAYIKYSTVIEADNELDAVDEAQRNEDQYKWYRSHEVEFNQTEFFQDEVEELTAEEAAIEIAHLDEEPSSEREQALEEVVENLKNNISAKNRLIQSLIDFDSEEVKRLEADNKRLREEITGVHDYLTDKSNQVIELQKEISSLKSDNKRLRKDAERYRHIREGNHWVCASTRNGFYVDGEHLDELIDADLEQGGVE